VSGTVVAVQKYMDMLNNHPLLHGIDFKIDDVDEPSFAALHVRYKDEIVNSGSTQLGIDPNERTGKHLEPKEFAEMMGQDDVVVLDVRSNYESGLGRFKGAIAADIDNFRDFPAFIKNIEQYKDKKVMTYCTGGIRMSRKPVRCCWRRASRMCTSYTEVLSSTVRKCRGKISRVTVMSLTSGCQVPVNSVNPTIICQVSCLRHCLYPHGQLRRCRMQ
jgi:UPF0176 protein